MENYNIELQHHGIKGMRWGIRRYQNKDGSLTPAGQKHYNKEAAKLKKEEAKFRQEKKIASNSKKVREKFDKLEARKKALADKKKALKESEKETDDNKKPEETIEERRARVLKSTDAKEIYKNKDILSSAEIQERLNRIDLEARLSSKIVEEHRKTALDYMDNATNAINKGTALLRSVDSAYSTVANSAIGKTLAKNLGIELPDNRKPRESLESFLKNIDKKSGKEIQDRSQVESNIKKLRDEEKRRNKEAEREAQEKAEKAAKEKKKTDAENLKKAQEAVDDYIKKEYADPEPDTTYRQSYKKATKKEYTPLGIEQIDKAPSDGKIYGKGTSKSSLKEEMDNGKKWWDTSNVYETVDFNSSTSSSKNKAYSENGKRTYLALLGVSDDSSGSSSKSSSSSSKSTQSDDYNDRIRKAADKLSKAAKDSTDAVNRTKAGEDIIEDLLRRNDDLLNGN